LGWRAGCNRDHITIAIITVGTFKSEVPNTALPRLRSDELLSRFWVSPRSADTHNRERQLAVDFIAAAAGGPTFYLGRDMKMSHKGMGITKADYAAFMRCLAASLDTFEVSDPERSEVVAFVTSLEPEIVEA
jgi:hemoglobin